MLVSVVARDLPALGVRHCSGAALLEPLANALEEAGLSVTDRCAATAADVAELRSSWARRLGIPDRRPAWRLSAAKAARDPLPLPHEQSGRIC